MNLVLQDIDYFLAFARTGHLMQAARSYNVTQSAIVNSIRRVEAHFGLPLLERNAHGSRVSSAGMQFVTVAKGLSAGLADAIHVMAEMQDQRAGVIRIGLPDAARASHVSRAVADILAERPGVRVKISTGRSDILTAQALCDGELDIALVPLCGDPPPGCDCVELGQDPLLPVVRAGHPLMKKKSLSLADLQSCAWTAPPKQRPVARLLRSAFTDRGLREPLIALEIDFASDFALSVVRRSDLVMFAPQSLLQMVDASDLRVLPVPELHCQRPVVLLTRKDMPSSPLMDAFKDAFAEAVRRTSMLETSHGLEDGPGLSPSIAKSKREVAGVPR